MDNTENAALVRSFIQKVYSAALKNNESDDFIAEYTQKVQQMRNKVENYKYYSKFLTHEVEKAVQSKIITEMEARVGLIVLVLSPDHCDAFRPTAPARV